ncbi:MAG TPA: hypothetical protein PKC09_12315, partial [Paracoccus sp. (in: a-proteobacteria)]|nr:hypothetical protein [Paracoccus sp. (in: a-proteobacteria)]HMR36157.1 hypothetical protein [Paracoccus sp. (in: a-proteobacteria)]
DRPDVDVRFRPFKLCFCHEGLLDRGRRRSVPRISIAGGDKFRFGKNQGQARFAGNSPGQGT